MKPLKVGDKVKVKSGDEQQSAHANQVATVTTVDDASISVKFDTTGTSAVYEESELVKQ